MILCGLAAVRFLDDGDVDIITGEIGRRGLVAGGPHFFISRHICGPAVATRTQRSPLPYGRCGGVHRSPRLVAGLSFGWWC